MGPCVPFQSYWHRGVDRPFLSICECGPGLASNKFFTPPPPVVRDNKGPLVMTGRGQGGGAPLRKSVTPRVAVQQLQFTFGPLST